MQTSKYLLAVATAALLFSDINAMRQQEQGTCSQYQETWPVSYTIKDDSGRVKCSLKHYYEPTVFSQEGGSLSTQASIGAVILDAKMTQDEIMNILCEEFGTEYVDKSGINTLPKKDAIVNALPAD